jgi:hypothetical protein
MFQKYSELYLPAVVNSASGGGGIGGAVKKTIWYKKKPLKDVFKKQHLRK